MIVDIDGTDISRYCLSKRWHPRLSRPADFIVRAQSRRVQFTPGVSELHVYDGSTMIFSGLIAQPQADGNANGAYTQITAYDHLIALKDRMVKTALGNLITPTFVETQAPGMFAEIVANSKFFDPGPFPLDEGSVAGGGIEVWGALSNFPMKMEQMRQLLVATGQLDIFLVPGIGSSVFNLTNGDGGNDLSGSVVFEYDTGSHNARVVTWTVDVDQVVNALWYLLGPRLTRERWKGSITPTAPHKGGTWPAPLLSKIALSRSNYGYKQEIQTKDEEGAYYLRPMYEAQWAAEANLRAEPITITSVLPNRGSTMPVFRPGDLIGVAAGSVINGGFSGAQRVYEMVVEEDPDGAIAVTDIVASANGET